MNKLLVLGLCLLAVSLTGCPRTAPPANKATASSKSDPRRLGVELLRQAPDTARYWEGLQLLNSDIQQREGLRNRLTPDAEAKKTLQQNVGLTAEELAEVETPTYQHADAYHVAECFLLRDAARAMVGAGAPPEESARQAIRWVERHVYLHEQGDDWLPPAQILRRGFGSTSDRVRVLLALLRQMQMEGCVFALADAPHEIVLVGIMPLQSPAVVYLFDPRHGTLLQTDAGKIATTRDVESTPALLKSTGLALEQFRAAEVRLACPLHALPLRMLDLEETLRSQERVTFHLDVAARQARLQEAIGRPVQVWKAAGGDASANSPTRALRRFLPPDEGGIDKTDRLKRFQADLVPWTSIRLALDRINLGRSLDELPRAALVRIIGDLLDKYDLQPRDMLLRGKSEEVVQRYERLRLFLEDENLIGLSDTVEFQRSVAAWRGKLTEAYASLVGHAPQAQSLVNSLWSEDQFVLALLQVEGEDRLTMAPGRGEDRPPPPKKAALTPIIAYVTRDYLNQRALWMRAQVWSDRAARDQARAEHAPQGNAPANTRSAWVNTRLAWNLFLDRPASGVAGRDQRLSAIRPLLKRGDERSLVDAAHLLETLHRDLHEHYVGRIEQARAVYHLEGAKPAVALLRSVEEELTGLMELGKAGRPGLKAEIDDLIPRLRRAEDATLIRSLQLLDNDWKPDGHYAWLTRQVRAQAAQWQK